MDFFLVGTALAEGGGAVSTQTRRSRGVIDIRARTQDFQKADGTKTALWSGCELD